MMEPTTFAVLAAVLATLRTPHYQFSRHHGVHKLDDVWLPAGVNSTKRTASSLIETGQCVCQCVRQVEIRHLMLSPTGLTQLQFVQTLYRADFVYLKRETKTRDYRKIGLVKLFYPGIRTAD